MIQNMFKYVVLSALVAVLAVPAFSQASELKELNFGIISTESSVGLKSVWSPFLQDMEKKLGMKIEVSPYAQVNGAIGAAFLAASL